MPCSIDYAYLLSFYYFIFFSSMLLYIYFFISSIKNFFYIFLNSGASPTLFELSIFFLFYFQVYNSFSLFVISYFFFVICSSCFFLMLFSSQYFLFSYRMFFMIYCSLRVQESIFFWILSSVRLSGDFLNCKRHSCCYLLVRRSQLYRSFLLFKYCSSYYC